MLSLLQEGWWYVNLTAELPLLEISVKEAWSVATVLTCYQVLRFS